MKKYGQFLNEAKYYDYYSNPITMTLAKALMEVMEKNIDKFSDNMETGGIGNFFRIVLDKYVEYRNKKGVTGFDGTTNKVLSIFHMILSNKTVYSKIKNKLLAVSKKDETKDIINASSDSIYDCPFEWILPYLNVVLSIDDIIDYARSVYEFDMKSIKHECAIKDYINDKGLLGGSYNIKKSEPEDDTIGIDLLDEEKKTVFQVKCTRFSIIDNNGRNRVDGDSIDIYGYITFSIKSEYKKRFDNYYWIFINKDNLDSFIIFNNTDIENFNKTTKRITMKDGTITLYTGLEEYLEKQKDTDIDMMMYADYRACFFERPIKEE